MVDHNRKALDARAAERQQRIADYEAAYLAANGKPCTVRYECGWYRITADDILCVLGVPYRGREIDSMTRTLRARVVS